MNILSRIGLGVNTTTPTNPLDIERTAGGLAVMESRQEVEAGDSRWSVESPAEILQTNALPSIVQTRLVGFRKLKSLLNPLHSWFRDKGGRIQRFFEFADVDRRLFYPDAKSFHKDNPYRRYRLNHRASQRTFKRIKSFVELLKLNDFAVASLVLTMPREVSNWLSQQGKSGYRLSWGLWEAFWSEDMVCVVGKGLELAAHVNLHTWRSEKPVEPHYHFHSLIPNYGMIINSKVLDENDEATLNLKKWDWHCQRSGREVPFSEEQLGKLKVLWAARLTRFCRRHGIAWSDKAVNIYIDFTDKWPKLLHKLNYNGRHWSENYAEYSNEHPDCPEPPEWLQGYENRAHTFGYWANLKGLAHVVDEGKEKLSPYTGEKMQYVGKSSLRYLLGTTSGRLFGVEFVRGKPVDSCLTGEDIEWLKMYSERDGFEDWEDESV